MRKVAVARCAFVVLTVSTLAASGAEKTVTNKVRGVEISVPEAWWATDTPALKQNAIQCTSPGDELEVIVTVQDTESGVTSKQFGDNMMVIFMTQSGKILAEGTDSKLGRNDAYKIIRKDERTKAIEHYLVAGKKGYVLFISGSMESVDLHAKDIDAIVKSFKLIEAK
ncbi:MAG TPA: hypothetical protein VKX17_09765 [Planctomycetota bacterium]|nr:hypothetical protein [Planctomycetota bacterium]